MSERDDSGIAAIDRVHAGLVRLARALHKAFSEGRSAEEIEPVLREFENLANQDFLHEESAMRETGFPGYASHKAEHEALSQDIALLKEQLKNEGPTSTLAVHTQRRIREWLVGHLEVADAELSHYLRKRM